MIGCGVRVAAILLVLAPAFATHADAQGRFGHGGGGGGMRSGPSMGGGGGMRSMGPSMGGMRSMGPSMGGMRSIGPSMGGISRSMPSMGRPQGMPRMGLPQGLSSRGTGARIGDININRGPGRQFTTGPSNRMPRFNRGGDIQQRIGNLRGNSLQGHRGPGRRDLTRGPRGDNLRNIARQRDLNRPGSNRPDIASRLQGDRNPAARTANIAGLTRDGVRRGDFRRMRNGHLALRNASFADRAGRNPATRALASSTFRGRFAEHRPGFGDRRWAGRGNWHDHRWRWWRNRIIVIGWVGPLFWPYAYDDFFDYTFWPYAYDEFWPYAYDDVYVSIFGPYAYAGGSDYYVGGPVADAGPPATKRARRAVPRPPATDMAQICTEHAAGLTDWPIERITQAIGPDDAQKAALSELKDATAKAVELLQSACPDNLPSTPTGRSAAMRARLETMLQVVALVRPPLERFYASLNDEQKARFNALDADNQPGNTTGQTAARREQPDLSRVCSGQAAAPNLPTERIEKALRPNDEQRAALQELNDASMKAADLLKANCPEDQSLTPPGRLAAMEARLNAMLQALNTVQPALEHFYNSLSDEQKARFNQLGTRQARQS